MRIVILKRTKLFLVVATVIMALSFVLVPSVPVSSGALEASTAEPPDGELTGTWTSESKGAYYVRQVGSTVWWVGQSQDGGATFTNVFNGIRNGDQITGSWADVPAGRNTGSGSLTLSISRTGGNLEIRKVRETGGFGENIWKKRGPQLPPGTCTISGRVIDDKPGYKTQLRLRRRPDNSEMGITTQAVNQQYIFTNVPEGTYQVMGWGNYNPGTTGLGIFSDESTEVTCRRDERVTLNFVIRTFE